jgi:MYXO-CTERM domain-containing protein
MRAPRRQVERPADRAEKPMWMWSRVFLAPLVGHLRQVLLLAGVTSIAVAPGQAEAAFPAGPSPQCVSGPCRQPEGVDVSFQRGEPVVLANFGLLMRAAARFEYACEETFGGIVPERLRFDTQGRLFVPSQQGIFISSDGCTWDRPEGELASLEVYDVALDPKIPNRVWALAGLRRVLYVSDDGGKTFTTRFTFAEDQYFHQLRLAPSNPDVVYVAGYGDTAPFILAVSTDGGATFRIDEAAPPATRTGQAVAFLGVAPDSPQTVYLALQHADGDQVWKSSQEGRDPVKLLSMLGAEALGGFAFGATPSTLYVSGRAQVFRDGVPTAHLYVSRDAGSSWETPIPSGPTGPFLRCLSYQAGALYACGAGTFGDDEYLIGKSTDEGKTWSALTRLKDLSGARACAAPACVATSNWLCESHEVCGGAENAPKPPAMTDDSGCACSVGDTRSSPPVAGWLAVLALWAWRRGRRGQA